MFLYPVFGLFSLVYFTFLGGCVLVSTYSLIYHRGQKRRLAFTSALVFVVGLIPLIIFLFPSKNMIANVSGAYQGNFGGGVDTLTLKPNGTFNQRFVTTAGKAYTSTGKWKFHAKDPGNDESDDKVSFDALILHADAADSPLSPKIHALNGAVVDSSSVCLYREDDDYSSCYSYKP